MTKSTVIKFVVTFAISLLGSELLFACGGGGGAGGGGAAMSPGAGQFSGVTTGAGGRLGFGQAMSPIAMQQGVQATLGAARQASAMQIARYNASRRAIRFQRASETRQQKLAAREARKQYRLAKMKADQNPMSSLAIAKASGHIERNDALEPSQSNHIRTWRDSSGTYQVRAMLVNASVSGVTLRKQDGSSVIVSMDRLSEVDQDFAIQVISDRVRSKAKLVGI